MKVIERKVKNNIKREQTFQIFRTTNINEQSAINELIDNALDAKATKIDILYDAKNIIIKDNGFGMSANILGEAFDIGNNLNKNSKFGRNGYGLAQCSLRFAEKVEVVTRDGKEESIRHIVLDDYADEGVMHSFASDETPGTTIKLMGHTFSRYKLILKSLSFFYGDLIESKKLSISLNKKKVESTLNRQSLLEDSQRVLVNWEGKKARVEVGLLADHLDPMTYRKFEGATFLYNGKVIELGIKDLPVFSGNNISEVAFFVEIIDDIKKWPLSSNKDSVLNKNNFMSSEIMSSIVNKWSKKGEFKRHVIKMSELSGFVAELMEGVFGKRKRATHTKDPDGIGVEPKEKHKRVDVEKEKKTKEKQSWGFDIAHTTRGVLLDTRFNKEDKQLTMLFNHKHKNYDLMVFNKEAAKIYVMSCLSNFIINEDSFSQDSIADRFGSTEFSVVLDSLSQANIKISLEEFIKE